MVEADRAANELARFAAAVLPENFVTVADDLAVTLKERHCEDTGVGTQSVTGAMWKECQRAPLQLSRLAPCHFQTAASGQYDVKRQEGCHRRQLDTPGRRQFTARVQCTAEAQAMQRFPNGIGWYFREIYLHAQSMRAAKQ